MSSLTLIGTVHRDPGGMQILIEELTRLHPEVITLEFSAYGLQYRLNRRRVLSKRLLTALYHIRGTERCGVRELKKLLRSTGIGGIKALLDLPYEYTGTRLYSTSHGLPFHCLDNSSYSRQLLRHVDELISPDNLRRIIALETAPLKETVAKVYHNAEKILLTGIQSPWLSMMHIDEEWEKREQSMADRIRTIAAQYPGCPIVHVGGWQHLIARQGTLFYLLEELRPKRILLGHLYL